MYVLIQDSRPERHGDAWKEASAAGKQRRPLLQLLASVYANFLSSGTSSLSRC
jgi:hypothetical protein